MVDVEQVLDDHVDLLSTRQALELNPLIIIADQGRDADGAAFAALLH